MIADWIREHIGIFHKVKSIPTARSRPGVYFVHADSGRAGLYIVSKKKLYKIFDSDIYYSKKESDKNLEGLKADILKISKTVTLLERNVSILNKDIGILADGISNINNSLFSLNAFVKDIGNALFALKNGMTVVSFTDEKENVTGLKFIIEDAGNVYTHKNGLDTIGNLKL